MRKIIRACMHALGIDHAFSFKSCISTNAFVSESTVISEQKQKNVYTAIYWNENYSTMQRLMAECLEILLEDIIIYA